MPWVLMAGSLIYPLHTMQAQAPAPGNVCSNLTIDPNKDFLGNFNNGCFAMPLGNSQGNYKGGDLNSKYDLVYYKVTPGYELVLTGTYPNARFFSITAYDEHAAIVSTINDIQIPPLNGSMYNPFLSSAPYQAQQYGVTIGFGGGVPVNVAPGCSTSDTTIDQTFLDASQIHQGLTWLGYPDLPEGFPAHQTGANSAGSLIVRSYVDISAESPPVLIVRQLSNGCAVLLNQISNIVTDQTIGQTWQNSAQVKAHNEFSYGIEPVLCFQADPQSKVTWTRQSDYIAGENSGASLLFFNMTPALVQSIITGGEFIRMQFQMPTIPNTPCNGGGCELTGLEQLRYRSISFENATATTMASIKDSGMVQDENGNVTLIIGMGTAPPPQVNPHNKYTYVNLAQVPNYSSVAVVALRDILPNATFDCSTFNVPFYTAEYNPEGGYMGNYVPSVDFPTASEIPTTPVPINRANSCATPVTQTPYACGTEGGN